MPSPNMTPTQRNVIVVGSGLAGLSASSQLIAHHIPVTILERSPKPGGNSLKASSGINGAPTKYQPGPPFYDSTFYSDTVNSAGGTYIASDVHMKKRRENLIDTLTNNSASAIEWLAEEHGVDLSVVARLGGHTFPRTHRGAGKIPPGASIVTTLLKNLKKSERFHIRTEAHVAKVLVSEKGIEGVEYSSSEGEKKALYGPVIFATGGFAGDSRGMLAQYREDLAGFPSTNEPGEGSQNLLTEVGAQLIDMEQVQIHPTSFIDPATPLSPVKFLAAEILRGEGGLLLHNGRRFINEMETRKNITDAIMRLPPSKTGNGERIGVKQWDIQLVLDEGVYANARSHVDFYVLKGLLRKIKIRELDADALETIKAFCAATSGQTIDIFGRSFFGHWKLDNIYSETMIYIGTVTPAVHFTMGGALISPDAEVLDENFEPIKGLWAAGEVSGGIHGENRLGGSSLLECVVFGRIAADGVISYLNKQK